VHHRRGLRRYLGDVELADAAAADWRAAALGPRREAMLAFVEKLTDRPGEMERSDVESLRAAGMGDAAILAVAEVAAYFAFVNRIASGLGVSLESEEP